MSIDLLEMLGVGKFFAGISWDPFQCMPPYKDVWLDKISEDMESSVALKIAEELRTELARIYGITVDQIDPTLSVDAQKWFTDKRSLATDKRFAEWRSRILVIMAKWMPNYGGKMMLSCDRVAGEREGRSLKDKTNPHLCRHRLRTIG